MTCGICQDECDRVICPDCDSKLADTGDDATWLRAAADWLDGKDDVKGYSEMVLSEGPIVYVR